MTIDRTKRVKEARDEAKKEIEAYRKQKDDEFKKFESEVRLSSRSLSSDQSSNYSMLTYLSTRVETRKPKMMPTKTPKNR